MEQLIDLLFSSIPTSNDQGEKEAYRALLREHIRLYGDERAREMRELCAKNMERADLTWAAAALRALPVE